MRHVIILLICSLSATAQVGTPSNTLSLASASRQSSIVPAGTTPTLSNVTVDTPAGGNDSIDVVVGNASVVISLITPGATEITTANASANGFTFTTYTADGTGDGTDLLSPFLVGGTHTVIQFPAPAQPGVYKVKANASSSSSDTAMTVLYYPSSSVSAGAVTDAATYRQGDLVILSGLVFDGQTPIQNATVTARGGTLLPVNGSVGNYQLVQTTQLDSTLSLYTYSARLTNTGAAANNVVGTVASTDPNMSMLVDAVAFGSVANGATAAARKATQALRNAGFAEDEVLSITGPELLDFLKEFKHHTGVWGEIMTEVSRFFDTEARKVDDDVLNAEKYSGFLAVHAPTDAEKARIVELVKPFSPLNMRWYLPSGIDNLL